MLKRLVYFVFAIILFINPDVNSVYAQAPPTPTPTPSGVSIKNTWAWSGNFSSLAELLSFIMPKAILIAGVIAFILVVIAGFGMISKAGSEDAHAQEKAKGFLTYAVIGLIIILGAYWILQIINFVTGGSLGGLI